MRWIGLVRRPSPILYAGERTHIDCTPINFALVTPFRASALSVRRYATDEFVRGARRTRGERARC